MPTRARDSGREAHAPAQALKTLASQRAYWRQEAIVCEMRKRENGLVRVAGWLPKRVRDKLKRVAKANGLTISQVLELAIKEL